MFHTLFCHETYVRFTYSIWFTIWNYFLGVLNGNGYLNLKTVFCQLWQDKYNNAHTEPWFIHAIRIVTNYRYRWCTMTKILVQYVKGTLPVYCYFYVHMWHGIYNRESYQIGMRNRDTLHIYFDPHRWPELNWDKKYTRNSEKKIPFY